jgi:hypothetical protein
MGNEFSDVILDRLIECDGSDAKGNEVKNDMLNNISKHIANTRDPFVKRSLNYSFWNLIAYILKKKVAATKGAESINFSNDELLAINYGCVSDLIAKTSEKFSIDSIDEVFESNCCINEVDIKFYSITQWLNEQLKEFMGIYEIEKLKTEYESKVIKTQEYKKSIEDNLMQKKQVLASIGRQINNTPLFLKIYNLSESINQNTNKFSLYKFKGNSGMALSKEERLELINIENEINTARNERKELIKSYLAFNNDLCKYEDNIIQNEIDLLWLISGLAKSKTDLDNFITSKNETPASKKEEFIAERITYIKNMFELISKRNKIEPTPCLSEKITLRIPDLIIEALSEYLKADPRVFKTKKFKRFGYPSVIFVPGCGNGIYSYDYNALIIPFFPATNFKESIISAMVLYRWDCDEDKEFREAFNSLKPYKKLSFVDLQRALIKNFIIYITKELKGYKIFDKEIRDWFAWQVSPKKDEIVDFEISKSGEIKREKKSDGPSSRPENIVNEIMAKAGEAKTKCEQADKLVEEAQKAHAEIRELANLTSAEAARLSEEAANKSLAAAHADISIKAEAMVKAAEASGKAMEATIKAAEAAKAENEAKLILDEKIAEANKLKNEAEAIMIKAKNESEKADLVKADEEARITQVKNRLGEMLKMAAAEENKAKENAEKIKSDMEKIKSDMQVKCAEAIKAEHEHKAASEVLNTVNGFLKLNCQELLKIKTYQELKNEALVKYEAETGDEMEEAATVSENDEYDQRTLFIEQLKVYKDEIEKLENENKKLENENEELKKSPGAAFPAGQGPSQAGPDDIDYSKIEVSERFSTARNLIYNKIKNIIKAENINDKLVIVPSDKSSGAISLHLLNLNISSGELDLLLNTLLIQSKLQKFIELIK